MENAALFIGLGLLVFIIAGGHAIFWGAIALLSAREISRGLSGERIQRNIAAEPPKYEPIPKGEAHSAKYNRLIARGKELGL